MENNKLNARNVKCLKQKINGSTEWIEQENKTKLIFFLVLVLIAKHVFIKSDQQ